MKHTQGTWEIKHHQNEFDSTIVDEMGREIAEVIAWTDEGANAQLIVSAPDMYKKLREFHRKIANGGVFTDDDLTQIDAVLKKAEGRS
jgi:hypothetical protein